MEKKVEENKKVFKISSTGRVLKPSRKLLTSSDDESKHPKKKFKSSQSMKRMKQEIDRLRLIAQKFENTEDDKIYVNAPDNDNPEVIMCEKTKETLSVPYKLSSGLDCPIFKRSMDISLNSTKETNLTHPTSSKVNNAAPITDTIDSRNSNETLERNRSMGNKVEENKKVSKTSSTGTILKPLKLTSSDKESKRPNKSKSGQSVKHMKQELNRLRLMTKNLKNSEGINKCVNESEKENIPNTFKKLNDPEVITYENSKETLSVSDEFSSGLDSQIFKRSMDMSLNSPKKTNLTHHLTSSKVNSAASITDTVDSHNSNEILERLTVLEKQMNELLEGHKQLMQQGQQILEEVLLQKAVGEVNVVRSFYEPLEGFPLNTLDQFDEIESDSQRSARKKMYHHLKSLGGSKLRDFLHSSLKEIMTDELVNKFTWSGGAESRNFGDTKIANILYLAAQNCPFFKGPESKIEFKIEMQEVLRAAKQRARNKIKKREFVTKEQEGDGTDGTDDQECPSEEMTEYDESDN